MLGECDGIESKLWFTGIEGCAPLQATHSAPFIDNTCITRMGKNPKFAHCPSGKGSNQFSFSKPLDFCTLDIHCVSWVRILSKTKS